MKIFFDTNVYVAEALLGEVAEEMLAVTQAASWRIYASSSLLDELERVLTGELGFSPRLAALSRQRVVQRTTLVEPAESKHIVADDPSDTHILRSALAAGADYLVTNDRHLLDLDPYEGVRIVSMTRYREILENEGLIPFER